MAEQSGERRTIALSIMLFWGLHYALLTLRMALAWPEELADASIRRIPMTLVAAASCWLIHLALGRYRHLPFGRRVALAALLTVPAALIYGAAGDFLFYYGPNPAVAADKVAELGPYDFNMFFVDGMTWFGSFFSWAAILLAISYNNDVREQERRLAQVRALAQSAQLRALRYQINPHFLFNTLNAISSLIWEKDFMRAEAMIVSLSAFLRASLESDPVEDVPLDDEIGLQRAYLAIEQARFGPRLAVDIDIDSDVGDARVPGLILQPLVENAIKYAVSPSSTETRLRIAASRVTDRLVIEVSDSGRGADVAAVAKGTGVGIENVRQRLETRFGANASLVAGERAGGFHVRLELPLRWLAA